MRERLLEMAKAWDDLDGYNQTILSDLSDAVASTASQLVVDDGDADRE